MAPKVLMYQQLKLNWIKYLTFIGVIAPTKVLISSLFGGSYEQQTYSYAINSDCMIR